MSPEEIKESRQKIADVCRTLKREWDHNPNNNQAVGCYKILNAVSNVLEEMAGGEEDEEYTFTRLIEGILSLANHHNVTLEDAVLRIGQARILFKQG